MSETEIKSINNKLLNDTTARASIASLSSQLAALTLQVTGNKLKLLNGDTVLSTVTLPTSSATAETYTITNILSHCSTSNSATTIEQRSSYSATITADSGYVLDTVTVTMGGTDITSSAYNASIGLISIDDVEGNIVITANAVVGSTGTVVGSINNSNEISLSGLSAGTYTLKYEDSTGTSLTDWDSICDMEVE